MSAKKKTIRVRFGMDKGKEVKVSRKKAPEGHVVVNIEGVEKLIRKDAIG